MTTLFPLRVENCFALPLTSRRFWLPSLPPATPAGLGILSTWLARKSSDAMTSPGAVPLSVSR